MNNIFKVTMVDAATWTGETSVFIQGQTTAEVQSALWEAIVATKQEKGWDEVLYRLAQFYNENELFEEMVIGKRREA